MSVLSLIGILSLVLEIKRKDRRKWFFQFVLLVQRIHAVSQIGCPFRCMQSVCARMYRYNVKLSLSTPWRRVGVKELQFLSFLTSILCASVWSVSRSGRFTFGTHCKRGGMGPRASPEILEKRCLNLARNQTPDRTVIPTTLAACNDAFTCSGLNAVWDRARSPSASILFP